MATPSSSTKAATAASSSASIGSSSSAPSSKKPTLGVKRRMTTMTGTEAAASSSSSSTPSTDNTKRARTTPTPAASSSSSSSSSSSASSSSGAKKTTVDLAEVQRIASQSFGHDTIRPNQLRAITATLEGRDCFVLAPTGGGKSLCYQLPALITHGVTFVVSPLIALMKNQVDYLVDELGLPAARLGSTIKGEEKQIIMDDLESKDPQLKLVYVSPELLALQDTIQLLEMMYVRGKIAMFAIDECHCISTWGHDFRPAYLKLHKLKERFPNVPTMALTATATRRVRDEIVDKLGLRKPEIIAQSFDRPEIKYEVKYKELFSPTTLIHDIVTFVETYHGECGIVYAATRANCQHVSDRLAAAHVSVGVYHAGLSPDRRTQMQQDWQSGTIKVIVSTVAFGMGIDKKDVRFVIHFNVPKSLESFYQESGRAGRDGEPAASLLYYSQDDKRRQEYFNDRPDKFERVSDSAVADASRRTQGRKDLFGEMAKFCEKSVCRRSVILQYFGETLTKKNPRCCDFCSDPVASGERTRTALAMATNNKPLTTMSKKVFSKKKVRDSEFGEPESDDSEEDDADDRERDDDDKNDEDGDEDEQKGIPKVGRGTLGADDDSKSTAKSRAVMARIDASVSAATVKAAQTNAGARNRLMDAMMRAEERDEDTGKSSRSRLMAGGARPKQKGLAKPPAKSSAAPVGEYKGAVLTHPSHTIIGLDISKRELCLTKITASLVRNVTAAATPSIVPPVTAPQVELAVFGAATTNAVYLSNIRDCLARIDKATTAKTTFTI